MALDPELLLRTLLVPTNVSLQNNTVQKGSIISFNYIGQRPMYQIHDSSPLVLVSDLFSEHIRGINMHYYTLPIVRQVIANKNMTGNPGFSYKTIMTNKYLVDAFRTYKRTGISNLRVLDISFLRKLLEISALLNTSELEAMKTQVRQMLERELGQPSA